MPKLAVGNLKSVEHTYYVTINPDPGRLHNGKRYDNRPYVHQIALIRKYVNQCIRWCKYRHAMTMYFEATKRCNIHTHFTLHLTEYAMKSFQVNISNKLGNSRLAPDICCHNCPENAWVPKVNPDTEKPYESWDEYCTKGYLASNEPVCTCLPCKVIQDRARIKKDLEYGKIIYEG